MNLSWPSVAATLKSQQGLLMFDFEDAKSMMGVKLLRNHLCDRKLYL